MYTIQKGDDWGPLAIKFYGSSTKWKILVDFNKDTVPDQKLNIGMVIKIPADAPGLKNP